MVNRWIDVSLVAAGVVIGTLSAGLAQWPGHVVSAQSGWQCRSWTLQSEAAVDVVEPWLGLASRVEISTASLDVAGRYILVACKQ